MSEAATYLSSLQLLQTYWYMISTLNLTAWQFPPDCTPANGSYFDVIVVGGGTAGSVIASRLSEDSNTSVFVAEAGGYPPLESEMPAMFGMLPQSVYDFNITTINNNYTFQNLRDSIACVNQGKMLGGSGASWHMMYTCGDPNDFNTWATQLNDSSWSNTNTREYFKKAETLTDKELLNSSYADLHGTDGPIKLTRELSSTIDKYFEALKECGHNIVPDLTSNESALGFAQPLYTVDEGRRVTTATSYLGRAKDRPNLCVSVSATVTKILFENNTAVGIQMTKNDETYVYYARKEVIVSAGAVNSPKLLLLSGVGPKEDLEALSIPVVADLPVGQYIQDQPMSVIAYKTVKSNASAPLTNPRKFPVTTSVGLVALNSSQTYPDYIAISLLLPRKSSSTMQLMTNVLRFSFDICDEFYQVNEDYDIILTALAVSRPTSRGKVWLASADPSDNPMVDLGFYSDTDDLKRQVASAKDFNRLVNSTFFKENNASLVNPEICANTTTEDEFWECYVVAMSSPMWHLAGSCLMGPVLDTRLRVKEVSKLRVIDASSLPTEISGKLHAAVVMAAEKASAIILEDWSSSS